MDQDKDKIIPHKVIKNEMMMPKFLNGKTINKILEFIVSLQNAVKSKSRKDCEKNCVILYNRLNTYKFRNLTLL